MISINALFLVSAILFLMKVYYEDHKALQLKFISIYTDSDLTYPSGMLESSDNVIWRPFVRGWDQYT